MLGFRQISPHSSASSPQSSLSRRAIITITSVVALLAGFLVAPDPGVSTAAASEGSSTAFAELDFEFADSYQDITGIHVYSIEPTINFESYDSEEAPAGYPDYSFELEIAASEQSSPLVQESVASTRNDDTSVAAWTVPSGVLEFGEAYVLRVRLSADGEYGEWVGWVGFQLTPPTTAPVLVSPLEGALVAKPAELVARIPDYEPNASSHDSILFTIQEGWQNGAPTVVDQLSGRIDSEGLARVSFSPYTNAGVFRWSAQWIGAGYSEPSEYREFVLSAKASPVSSLQAYPGAFSATLQWYVQSPVFAPLSHADITIMPGDISRRVDAPATSAEFSDLPLGDYVARITVTNALGESTPVSKSFTVTPTIAPAVQELTHAVTASGVHLSWQPPVNDGGSPITHYKMQVRSYDGGTNISLDATDIFADIELDIGFSYLVYVYPVNAKGWGAPAAVSFETYAVPGAPQNIEIRQGDGFVNVYWDAPEDHGGRSLTNYRIEIDGLEPRVIEATWGRTGAQIDGIENGKTYTVTIRAHNEVGAGDPAEIQQILGMSSDLDSDSDGLPDVVEARFGTSSTIADTDGDGINDVDEALKLSAFLSPVLADTDGNGVPDGDEDTDGDGLSNSAEILGGTNPSSPDSDHDSLSDFEELTGVSNPLVADSDNDGISDGVELRLGLDPNAVDTDSDGLPDADEVVTQTVQDVKQVTPQISPYGEPEIDDSVGLGGVSASVTGPAHRLEGVFVTSSPADDLVGSLTVMAEVVDSAFSTEAVGPQFAGIERRSSEIDNSPSVSALSFKYAEGVASARLQDLAPVRWNAALSTWEFADNDVSISTAEHTLSILSPELGLKYAIVDLNTWRAHVSECDSGATGRPQLDVEFVIDGMPSVLRADTTKERLRVAGVILDSLKPGDRASVREFGLEEAHFSGGSAWLFSNDIRSELSSDDLFGLDSLERSRAQLGALQDRSSQGLPAGSFDWDSEAVLAPSVPDASLDVNPYVDSAVAMDCRKTVVVFITDGERGEVFSSNNSETFADADIPVHVFDLGIGSEASTDWLEALAQSTDGTYSYIPTQSDLAGWIIDVTPVELPWWDDSTTDTDGDGLPDIVELYGVAATLTERGPGLPVRFYSDPTSADSDDDGIPDNVEIGQRLEAGTQNAEWTPQNINRNYWVVSDPGRTDSDLDGLDDRSEYDLSLNPLAADGDADGLTDSVEEMYGTFSNMYDTDSDGFSDLYEVMHEDDGFDPLIYDEPISEHEWLAEAAVGFFCGEVDICSRFSIPWLVGNIASGLLVFGDLRDGIALVAKGDFIAAGFCALGLIPGIGDSLGAAAKIVRFAGKFLPPIGLRSEASLASAASVSVAAGSLGPRQIMTLLRKFTKTPTEFVKQLEKIDSFLVIQLRSKHEMSDAAIAKMVGDNGYDNIRRLLFPDTSEAAALIKTYRYTAATAPRLMDSGRAGEVALGEIVPELAGYRQKLADIVIHPGPGETFTAYEVGRFWDGKFMDGEITRLFEAKVGGVGSAFAKFQIRKDAAWKIVDEDAVIEWHFFASEISGRIGPSKAVMDDLVAAGITMVFHFPKSV